MAASHRSPLMRDQWRAEDKYRDDTHHSGRGKAGHRRESPSASKRQSDTDIGVKIRGRAAADNRIRASSREDRTIRQEGPRRSALKDPQRSPQRRSAGEGPSRRPRDFSADRSKDQYPGRHQHRGDSRLPLKRQRSRSKTPHQAPSTRKEDRRSHSPVIPNRTDRAPRIRSRNREHAYPRRSSPRGNYYSANYDDISNSRSIRDSYVPSGRRSRSPPFRDSRPLRTSHRRSPSPSRRQKPREKSPTRRKGQPSHNSRLVGERDPVSSIHKKNLRSREPSRSRQQRASYQRRVSRPRSLVDSRQPVQNRRYSQTPPRSDRPKDSRNMQSSTRPIQSILDDGSRPPSPPRPIPSFDSENHNPNIVRDAYPMHGMKANDMHDSRAGRPNIDTRQPYATSPQWTPTSSHHGSPQSSSPFSHGRGGWGGPQQFHGQPGYVFVLFIYGTRLIYRPV